MLGPPLVVVLALLERDAPPPPPPPRAWFAGVDFAMAFLPAQLTLLNSSGRLVFRPTTPRSR